jgi:general secretion pathway protein L
MTLADLFAWWCGEMRGLLPRRAGTRPPDALVLREDAAEPGTWQLLRRRRGATTPIATLPAGADIAAWQRAFAVRRRREPVAIALDQPFLLRQTTVPAAASGALGTLLRYEMDRLTPFAADDVVFDHRVTARDASGLLHVDLALVPKARIAAVLDRLAGLSLRPEALEAPPPFPRIGLASFNLARARLVWRSGLAACVVTAFLVLAIPLLRQSLSLARVEDRIAALRPEMEQVDALRRRIAASTQGAGRIAQIRKRATEATIMLADLTDLLPDDTFLTSLSFRNGQVTMEGHSAAAARIIAALAADPHFRNPAFAAPQLRSPDGRDVFTIQTGFAP